LIRLVECEGAPRDLGRDQGEACREALHARFARASRITRWRNWLGLVDPEAEPLDRELWRHFPHQAETLRGLGVAAREPAARLVSELGRLRADAVRAVALEAPTRLARGLTGAWIVRRNRPEGLFASLDVALHGVAAPLIGVNERGLAVAVLPGRGERRAPPAWLLGQDCLERFEQLEPALDWCLARPGGSAAGLLLADAGGGVAGVRFDTEPRVLRPSDGRIVDAPSPDVALLEQELAGVADIAALAETVSGAASAGSGGVGAAVDVAERTLCVAGERFSL
jgi:hypothetical protein